MLSREFQRSQSQRVWGRSLSQGILGSGAALPQLHVLLVDNVIFPGAPAPGNEGGLRKMSLLALTGIILLVLLVL